MIEFWLASAAGRLRWWADFRPAPIKNLLATSRSHSRHRWRWWCRGRERAKVGRSRTIAHELHGVSHVGDQIYIYIYIYLTSWAPAYVHLMRIYSTYPAHDLGTVGGGWTQSPIRLSPISLASVTTVGDQNLIEFRSQSDRNRTIPMPLRFRGWIIISIVVDTKKN